MGRSKLPGTTKIYQYVFSGTDTPSSFLGVPRIKGSNLNGLEILSRASLGRGKPETPSPRVVRADPLNSVKPFDHRILQIGKACH
jgi:hypothetical protein